MTIDTLEELVSSKLTYGGWGELSKEFFKGSPDPIIQKIANNFLQVNSSEDAVNKVAEAAFAFYENTYFLQYAIAKQRERLFSQTVNATNMTSDGGKENQKQNRNLHIMSDCIINVPVSLGKFDAKMLSVSFSNIIWRSFFSSSIGIIVSKSIHLPVFIFRFFFVHCIENLVIIIGILETRTVSRLFKLEKIY